ncbi:hypothetical protein PR202_ga12135 [Eleusine coracana subsp. coracana]|uniref:Uncharacterized protein n=1 Tax=Eleusine coracana subsp. coracana TaxID=191504 RepID=A0AAV5CAV8_ELECO|nr:hypothetical protein PR202_ga12135 [Eleusine coracana subsp. coracana]
MELPEPAPAVSRSEASSKGARKARAGYPPLGLEASAPDLDIAAAHSSDWQPQDYLPDTSSESSESVHDEVVELRARAREISVGDGRWRILGRRSGRGGGRWFPWRRIGERRGGEEGRWQFLVISVNYGGKW